MTCSCSLPRTCCEFCPNAKYITDTEGTIFWTPPTFLYMVPSDIEMIIDIIAGECGISDEQNFSITQWEEDQGY